MLKRKTGTYTDPSEVCEKTYKSLVVRITKIQFRIINQEFCETKPDLTQLWFETVALREVRKKIVFPFRFSCCD